MEKNINELQRSITRLRTEVDTLKEQERQLPGIIQRAKIDKNMSEKKIDELTTIISTSESELSKARKSVPEKERKIAEIKKSLDEMSKALDGKTGR